MPGRAACRAIATLAVLAVAVVAGARTSPAAQPDGSSPCAIQTTERIVAVGDVHGAYDRLVAILRAAGLTDRRARWTGGRAILVQTGDVVDRGPDSRRVLDLLRRLEREAARAGGQVHALVGNHEAMRLMSHWNDVSEEEYAAFRTRDSDEVRERLHEVLSADAARQARAEKRPFDRAAYRRRFLREVPLGFIEMRHAFGPDGEYGRWIRERLAMVRINGIVFVHGGADLATAGLGCDGINAAIREELALGEPSAEAMGAMISQRETGPLWYRGLHAPAGATEVDAVLRTLDARAMVVGHTPVDHSRIAPRHGGRVIAIDTGMLGGASYPRGVASALEIRGDELTAVYEDRREALPPLPSSVP
jgi:hypothetical protein